MKKLLVLAVFVAAGAQAAKMQTCKSEILKACGNNSTVRSMVSQADAMTEGDQCNVIDRFKREGSANDYSAKRVVFKDSEKLITVVVSNEGPGEAQLCSYKVIDLKGKFIETKVHAGRMYAVTSSIGSDEKKNGRVAVITRVNTVQWLVNTEEGRSKGIPFYNVKDISIDQQASLIKLTFANGHVEAVNYQEALEGLNKYKQFVSGGQ